MSTNSNYSFFKSVEKSFDKAAKFTKWNPGILEQIKACNSVYQMRFPVKLDNGTIEVIDDACGDLPASIGDYVWHDVDANGIQDANEVGIGGVTVTLTDVSGNSVLDANGNPVGNTTTLPNGFYEFTNLAPGNYMFYLEDGVGCKFEKPFAISSTGVDDVATVTNVTCNGLTNGSINITSITGVKSNPNDSLLFILFISN